MKDKRGITSQFCTLHKTTPQQIVNAKFQIRQSGGGNTKQGGSSIVRLGNFEYVSKELRLGMLSGNRFDIILRNVKVPADTVTEQRQLLEHAAQAVKDKGFINYFGTQRFGKFNDTHLVGIAVLQGHFKKAVQILMQPKLDEREDIKQARLEWKERFNHGETKENEAMAAKRVLKKLNRFMTGENAVLQSLSRHPMDYKKAFGCIPVNLRTMFIHAVQSLIWNRATSYRIAKMDKGNVMVGDLVYENGTHEKPKVRVVTEADISNNRYTIEDVVVPMVGKLTKFPTNELGTVMKKLLTDIGINHDVFKKSDNRALIVTGDYRKIICHPKDFDFTIMEYFDPLQPLLQTDLMKLQGEDIAIAPPQNAKETAKMAMIVGFTLPSSSYATIALRELMKRPTSNEFQKELTLE
jgi:tRNA pseudouridine13 synthase